MRKARGDRLLVPIFAFIAALVFAFGFFGADIRFAHATENLNAGLQDIWIATDAGIKPLSYRMPRGMSYEGGVLTIGEDCEYDESIWIDTIYSQTDKVDYAVRFERDYGSAWTGINNEFGNLTLTSDKEVTVTLFESIAQYGTLTVSGKVNLIIVGQREDDNHNLVGAALLWADTLIIKDDASVSVVDPAMYEEYRNLIGLVYAKELVLDTTGCFKAGLNATPSADAVAALYVTPNGSVTVTKCEGGFELFTN
ncbi:MAG: hypothetical protein J6U35_00625, partial [Clostridia bacterium]|nr:hypothetical protein [Clostridia bacterium]